MAVVFVVVVVAAILGAVVSWVAQVPSPWVYLSLCVYVHVCVCAYVCLGRSYKSCHQPCDVHVCVGASVCAYERRRDGGTGKTHQVSKGGKEGQGRSLGGPYW